MCRIAAPVFAFLLLVAPAVGTADALPDTIRVIDEGSGLEPDYVPGLIGQAAREYEKLKVLFHNDVGVVTIRLRANGPARHLPPADIVIPAPRVRDGRAVTAHEITHLLNQGWANGLLKEGLAVWAQDRVGEQAGWPNEGRLIHQVARAAITEADPLVRGPSDANKVLSTRNPGMAKLRRAAYAVAGSWVTWLIETQFAGDVMRFQAELYRTGNYQAVLGRPFKPLRREWRAYLDRFKP